MRRMPRAWFFLPSAVGIGVLGIAVVTSATVESLAAQNVQTAASTPEAPELELLQQYCFRCHAAATQRAGLDLEGLTTQHPLVRNREMWERVIEMVEIGRMPPPEAPQPTDAERAGLHASLSSAIYEFDYSTVDDPGFESMRRLTHEEYDNTLRDLFGIDINPTDRFPDELSGSSGFVNSANTLFLQPSLMERYIAVAERVVEVALPLAPEATAAAQERTRDLIFIATPDNATSELEAAEQVLEHFLTRAYRRPPSESEGTQAIGQYLAGRAADLDHERAIKRVLQAVLISPKFLFRVEAGSESAEPFSVTDWELASRLSYFIWASMPDDELFDLAAQGVLREPETISAQIDRMLASPKANTLGDVFAGQWLGFEQVGTRIWLDPIDNPWCTATLMTAMRDETSMFFMSLLRDNQPIDWLIDADYTFVNEELATTLYGMDAVQGEHMRRIELTDPNRGGILGQASVLALTSDYTQTSPVKRGIYVLETLLGTPPPPPPPGAGVLSEEVDDMRNLKFREKLELHSTDPTCRSCHSKIDPIGFSMENYDFFGQWRDTYDFRSRVRNPEEAAEVVTINTETSPDPITVYYKNTRRPISVDGSLPNGATFVGPAGLKQALLEHRHDDLVRQTVSKMLSYALGRQLDYYDEPAIRGIIARLEADEYRFHTLLQAVVESYPFQYKKNPEESTL